MPVPIAIMYNTHLPSPAISIVEFCCIGLPSLSLTKHTISVSFSLSLARILSVELMLPGLVVILIDTSSLELSILTPFTNHQRCAACAWHWMVKVVSDSATPGGLRSKKVISRLCRYIDIYTYQEQEMSIANRSG